MEGTGLAVFSPLRRPSGRGCSVKQRCSHDHRPERGSCDVLHKAALDCTEIILPALEFFLTQFPRPVDSDATYTSADEISTLTTFPPVELRRPATS
jgi:hypothetical protein